MRLFSLFLLLVQAALAESPDAPPEIMGRGDWGEETMGLACRVTTDRTEYAIGEEAHVLVEVENRTDKPIALGLEPLVENRDGELIRQPANISITLDQCDKGQAGFFHGGLLQFPSGTKSGAKAISLGPSKAHSEVFVRQPWGPCYGCLPSTAQPGRMTLQVSLIQVLTGDLKRQRIPSNKVELSVRPAPDVPTEEMDGAVRVPR